MLKRVEVIAVWKKFLENLVATLGLLTFLKKSSRENREDFQNRVADFSNVNLKMNLKRSTIM